MPNTVPTAEYWIDKLGLQEHPEGGYFKEVYRSEGIHTLNGEVNKFPHLRNYATYIYFLIPKGVKTRLHRIKSDELWQYIAGDQVSVHCFQPDDYRVLNVGNPAEHQETSFMEPVFAGEWFGAESKGDLGYSLLGMFVAPGFDFQDFELASFEELTELMPKWENELKAFF